MERKERLAYFLLIFFHLAGIVFLQRESTRIWSQQFAGGMLLLSFICLLMGEKQLNSTLFIRLSIISFLGFLLELIGITTSIPFGPYHYTGALGVQIAGVPPIIGLNWAGLLYAFHRIFSDKISSKWILAGICGAGMTLFDLLLEPVAIKLNYWVWESPTVPIQNYVSWFTMSLLFSLLLPKGKNTGLSITYLAVQTLYFLFVLIS